MDSENANLELIVKGAGIVFVGVLISKLLSYLYRLVVARIGTSEYGMVSIGLAVFELAVLISMLGLEQGCMRFIPQYLSENNKSRVKGMVLFSLGITLFSGIVIAAILFLASNFVANNIFHDSRLAIVLKLIAIAVPFGSMRNVLSRVARGFKRVDYEVSGKYIVENVLKLVLSAVLIYIGYTYVGAVVAYVLAIIITAFLFIYLIKKLLAELGQNISAEYSAKSWLNYSIPLLFNAGIVLLIAWSDTLLLGHFRTASEVGIYNAAAPTAQLTYMFPIMLLSLFLPIITDFYVKKDKVMFAHTYKIITKWIYIINLGLLVIILAFSGRILATLFGASYSVGSVALSLLVIGNFIYHLALTSNDLLLVFKKTKLLLVISMGGLIVSLLLNVLLIPIYGIVGASVATLTSFTLMACLLFVTAHKYSHINPFNWKYITITLSAIISAWIVYCLVQLVQMWRNILILMFAGAIFLLIYFAMLLMMRSFDKEDFIVLDIVERKAKINLRFLRGIISNFVK